MTLLDSTSLTITESSWADEWPKLPSLLARHAQELGEGLVVLDLGTIAQLDESGALSVTVVHDSDGPGLVGYCIWYLGPDLSKQGSLCAQMGPFYVLPGYRHNGLGTELLAKSLEVLRNRRVSRAFPHQYEKSPNLGPLFESLGGVAYERVWQIDLRLKNKLGWS